MNTFHTTSRSKTYANSIVQSKTRNQNATDLPAHLKAFFVLREEPKVTAQTAPSTFVQP